MEEIPMLLTSQQIIVAETIGQIIAILLYLGIMIGINFYIFTKIYKWLIKNNFIEPKTKQNKKSETNENN